MNRQSDLKIAHEKMDRFNAMADEQLIERAWDELGALCGSNQHPPKKWQMRVPVDYDSDSDVLFGEILIRFARHIGHERPR